jgi:hypothetical protein
MIIIKNIQYNLDIQNITILNKMSIYQIYNQIKEDFMTDQLISYPFPIDMLGEGEYQMINRWTMRDSRNII